jgi:curli biogenesis system outer membrane secretion channel CsgG
MEMGVEGVIAVGVGVAMAAVALTVVPVSTREVVKSDETLEFS